MPERCPGDYPHLSAFSANALDDLGIPRCPVSTATRSAPIEPEQNPLPGAPLPNLAALNLEEPVALDFGARAQDFLKRITPLFCRSRRPRPHSAPWPSRNSTEFAKPKSAGSKPATPWPPSSSHSPSIATRSAPWTPITWSCAQEKCATGLPRSSLAPPSASLEKSSLIPPSSSTANSKPAKLPAPVPNLTSRFRRLRLPRPTLETRPLALCLRHHLLSPLQKVWYF
jgi:hypothetical protein